MGRHSYVSRKKMMRRRKIKFFFYDLIPFCIVLLVIFALMYLVTILLEGGFNA